MRHERVASYCNFNRTTKSGSASFASRISVIGFNGKTEPQKDGAIISLDCAEDSITVAGGIQAL